MGDFPAKTMGWSGRVRLHALSVFFCLVIGFLSAMRNVSAAPLEVVGNFAFLPDQLGQLKTVALGGGTNATPVATFSNLTDITGLSLYGQYAAVSVATEGLFIFDVSQSPPDLVSGGRFGSLGTAEDIKVSGTTAFIADGENGITVVDLFNPANPLEFPSLNPPGEVSSIDIVSNRLYAACGSGGLLISDISNVTDANPLAEYDTAAPARRVRVVGNYAYVICDDARIEIINVQTPTAPTLASVYVTNGYFADVDARGSIAVVANTNGFLTVLNLTNPAAPTIQSRLPIAGGALGVRLSGANAYVRNGAGELVVIPLAALTATAPQLKQGVPPQLVAVGQTTVFSVLVTGTTPLAYRWNRDGIPLADDIRIHGSTNAWLVISNTLLADAGVYSVTVSNSLGQLISSNTLTVVHPGAPIWRGSFDPGGSAEALDVNDFRVYVAAGTNGLEVYSALNPRFPQRFSGNYVEGFATGIGVNENYAFVAAATNGLQVYNTSSFNVSDLIAATNTPGTSRAVFLAGGLAYLADGENGLLIFHLQNETAHPTFVGGYHTPGYAWNVFVAGGIAYVADGTNGIQILSVTNPAAIVKLGEYDTPGEAHNVKVAAGKAYVADGPNGLVILDIANPASPTVLGSYSNASPALDLDLVVDTVVLARGTNGVESLNVANPAAILSLGTYANTLANGLRVEGDHLYVAAGINGVQIFELLGLPVSYPDLTITPLEIIALPGEQLMFHANATGTAPLRYQWYKGGTPLFDDFDTSGTGAATLIHSNLTLADTDEYFVVVRNGWNLSAIAQANLTVVPVGTPVFRSGYFNEGDSLNTHVVGQTAFVASRLDGLQAIDCRDPLEPVLIGQHPTLGLAQAVRVKGHYAYVASWDAGLEIFDISDPTNLVRVGSCDTPGFAHAIQVAGNFAHVANRGSGYSIIDIRDPTHPTVVGSAATDGIAEGLAVAGSQAYIACSAAGMEVYDFSNPLAPTRMAQFDTPGNAENVSLAGNRAYISDYHRGVCIVDVNNPAAPTQLGQLQTTGDAFHVQIVGDRAYIAEGIGKVEMADVGNPAQPAHISTSLAGSSVRGLHIIGKHAFLADREDGFVVAELLGLNSIAPSIVDFSSSTTNLAGSELVLSVAAEGTPPLGYTWFWNGVPLTNSETFIGANDPHLIFPSLASTNAGNYTVVVTNALGSVTSAVASVTITTLGAPMARGIFDTPGNATAAAVFGNVAYIADGTGGLQLVNLSNLDNLVSLGSYAPTGIVFGVCLQTNFLYLALGTNGIAILDVTQPMQPAFVGAFDTPGTARNLDVANGRLFVADGEAGMRILNLTIPAIPTSLGFLATTGNTRDVRVSGNLAFIADEIGGLRIATITNPAAPLVIGSYISAGQANAVRLVGNRAYVANGTAGLLILDVQDPTLPVPLGTYPTTNATALDLVGNIVVLADGPNGYLILDVSNPANVVLVGNLATGTAANGSLVVGNLAFLSSGTNGLRLAELFGVSPAAAAFLTQPTSTSVLFGGVAQFQATPVGPPPLTFRWYHNDLPVFDDSHITGAASNRLTVSNVAFADAGNYQLRVLGPAGVTNSATAKLTFIGPLQAQLNTATNGAVITLASATYTENLVLDRNLTLTGAWWNKPLLNGGFAGPALHILPGASVTLRGIALRNGFGIGIGGGIINEGTLTLDHCLIADNAAVSGGGIANLGTLYLFQSVISNNTATAQGGGFYNSPAASAFIINSVFVANSSEEGGGFFNLGTNTLFASLLTANFAQGALGNGGGYRQSSGSGQLINCTLSGNIATSWTSQSGTALGGGARVDGGRLDLLFSTVANNTASFRAGGISVTPAAEVHARNSVFAGNLAPAVREFGGTLYSDGYNLVQQTSGALSIVGDTTGNQLNVNAQLGPLQDNGGSTLTHAPKAGSPIIDAGAPPGPTTDARGIARPFDVPWIANANTGWDLGAIEYVDTSLYLVMSNRTATGFTLAWATNAVLQKSFFPGSGWLDQTNTSPMFVATTNQQDYFRLHAPFMPIRLISYNKTTTGFDLSWPDFGILEHAPTTSGPWDVLTGVSPFHINIVPGQNEFFRLRVIEH